MTNALSTGRMLAIFLDVFPIKAWIVFIRSKGLELEMKFFKLATISAFALSAAAMPAYANPSAEASAGAEATADAQAPAQAPATPDASGAAATPGAPAATAPAATTDVNLAAGAKVYDASGGEVGTIESVASGAVVVNTGAKKATLAENSFVAGPKGATIGMTKQQLEEAVAAATAGGQ